MIGATGHAGADDDTAVGSLDVDDEPHAARTRPETATATAVAIRRAKGEELGVVLILVMLLKTVSIKSSGPSGPTQNPRLTASTRPILRQ